MTYEILNIDFINKNFSKLTNKEFLVEGYFKDFELVEREGKSSYFKSNFFDKTGSIGVVLWEEKDALEIYNILKENPKQIIKLFVSTNQWKNVVSLKIKKFKVEEEKTLTEFIENTKKDYSFLNSRIKNLTEKISNPELKKLVSILTQKVYSFDNDKLKAKYEKLSEKFLRSPAATTHHHNYVGGLIEHSIGVTESALFIAQYYSDIFEVDVDKLIVAGLIHDIGKIREYSYENGIERSEEGNYIYHTVSGVLILHDLINDFEIDIDEKTKRDLIHIISSHHGEYAEFTPNEFCIEAHLISQADLFDSQCNKAMKLHSTGQLKRINRRL